MKKNILFVLPLMLMGFILTSCEKDEIKSESVIVADSYVKNDFDKWLEANFVNPYNIDFKYRYEEIESDYNYYTIPADMDNAILMAHILKYLCMETYDEVAGIEFTRSYFPKMFYLIGEWEYRNNGSMILGTAEGGKKILLAGINLLDDVLLGAWGEKENVAENLNHYYIKTIHHEFTHILNQTRDYPTSFQEVTGASYVNDSQFSEPYVKVYLKRGFISAYAQTEPKEDFAEMVSEYVTHTPEWWEKQLEDADTMWEEDPEQTQTGRVFIEQKLDIVRAYMSETWNIDIDVLRDCILTRQANLISGKIDLEDISLN